MNQADGPGLRFHPLGQHWHQAECAGHIFLCARRGARTAAGGAVLWAAFKDDVLLRSDCATLAEAIERCRAAADEVVRGELPSALAPAPSPGEWQRPAWPVESCERDNC